MLNTHIYNKIKSHLEHIPTSNQEESIQKLSLFITDNKANNIFLLKGYAGTGKTTLISALIKTMNEFKIRAVLMAPTGRAAKILSSYSQAPASTIHKKIYRQRSLMESFASFTLDRNQYSNSIFIVDEASMIAGNSSEQSIFGSGNLLEDMIKYIHSGINCKLILIGDDAQLPPVGYDNSPALSESTLKIYADCESIELTEVVRQSADSGILSNATHIREQLSNTFFSFPKFLISKYTDVEAISGSDLIERLSDAYRKYGPEETIVLSRSNKRANVYNQGIRSKILYSEDEIMSGDRIMVVKNSYQSLGENSKSNFIANGDIGRIRRIKKHYERYGLRFASVDLELEDYGLEIDTKIVLDTLNIESAALPYEKSKELFLSIAEDHSHITEKKKRYAAVRQDSFFNALQIKFAYAITVHKAQGGQWDCVFLDMPYFADNENLKREDLRWFYTAVTRAKKKIFLVNFDPKYLM